MGHPPFLVQFDGSGRLLVGVTSISPLFQTTWNPDGNYHTMRVELNPCTNVIEFWYDEEMIHSSAFGPSTSRSIQSGYFAASKDESIWDIDDYSVTRGSACPTECPENSSETCGEGFGCIGVEAVAVSGERIERTQCVFVRPGDQIDAELKLSDWHLLPRGVRLYQVALLGRFAAVSGGFGTVTPLGWDAAVLPSGCISPEQCSPPYQYCTGTHPTSFCIGPNHMPELGGFIDVSRPDFLFHGLGGVYEVRTSSLNFAYLGIRDDGMGSADTGIPRYLGTLRLVASHDACGTFQFITGSSAGIPGILGNPDPDPIVVEPSFQDFAVRVCQDDGIYCNGVESCDAVSGCVVTPPPSCDDDNDCTTDSCNETTDSCDHVATCGACCDSWIGECTDSVDPIDCVCTNCIWTGGADCADVVCEAQFVVIPAVSEWGLVVLTLTLLVAAKIRFRPPATTSKHE